MNIAVQAADLDAARIDGTRVYLSQMLRRFGALDANHRWHLFHRSRFNPELEPPSFPNYDIRAVSAPLYWTQTRFAWEMWKLRPERLWMPVQALPFFLPKDIRTTVTIHDLAFKYFPDHFPKKDQRRLHLFADFAVRKATKLIAVSESTKRDILKWYPEVAEEKIRVIYHGFDSEVFRANGKANDKTDEECLRRHQLTPGKYFLYVGAIQPRKNICVLLDAFASARKNHSDMKLVLAGEQAWLWQETMDAIEKHPFRKDIVLTGTVSFAQLSMLYACASAFVFPSLYEGFGIPVLEAMAAGVPVVCSDNSSLPEVGGDAALYFTAEKSDALAKHLEDIWTKPSLREQLIRAGEENIRRFSWDKCARETLEYIIR